MSRRRPPPPEGPKPSPPDRSPDPGASLGDSVDVQFSSVALPKADAPDTSGSLDVQFSSVALPRADAGPSPAAPPHPAARRRASTASGIAHKLSEGAHRISEGAHRLSEGAHKLGESLNDSINHLPVMPKTRKSRVLVRSLVVGFVLVFSWIAVIVGLQLRTPPPPDFRPQASAILIAIRDGLASQVYAEASTRLHEVVLEEKFVDEMDQLNRNLGPFREITAVFATETPPSGPGGRTARVDLQLEFAKGATRGNVSFHYESGRWKLLGISVSLPPDILKLATSEAERKERVKGDPDVEAALKEILEQSKRGEARAIWANAAPVFQQSMSEAAFVALEERNLKALGQFQAILAIVQARRNPNQTTAKVTAMLQYAKSPQTPGTFRFANVDGKWKLTQYYVIHPLPKAPQARADLAAP